MEFTSWNDLVAYATSLRVADETAQAVGHLLDDDVECFCTEWPGDRYLGAHHPYCRRRAKDPDAIEES